MPRSTVVIRSTKNANLDGVVEDILKACGWESIVLPNFKVVIKLNLNSPYREHIERGANTSLGLIAAVCRVLQQRTSSIVVGDSDGTRFSADDVASAIGLDRLTSDLGVKLVNFSRQPTRPVDHPLLDGFELPEMILEADVLITLPVLKTHALTVFTGAVKNQWGCIPRYDRILLHKHLDLLLADINQILHPRLAIMDAITAMDGRGPCNGNPRRLDLLIGSKDVVGLDATAMRLVGLDPYCARHIVLAHQIGLGEIDDGKIEIDGEFDKHKTQFKGAHLDWAVWAMNYMTRFTWFVRHILLNDRIYWPTRKLVNTLRKAGLVR